MRHSSDSHDLIFSQPLNRYLRSCVVRGGLGKKAELITLSVELYFIHYELEALPEEWRIHCSEGRTENNRNGLEGLTRGEDTEDFQAWLSLCPILPYDVLSPVGILPIVDSFRVLLSSSKYLVASPRWYSSAIHTLV